MRAHGMLKRRASGRVSASIQARGPMARAQVAAIPHAELAAVQAVVQLADAPTMVRPDVGQVVG